MTCPLDTVMGEIVPWVVREESGDSVPRLRRLRLI